MVGMCVVCLTTLEIEMKLYGFPPSPNTRKVQAVAAHLQIPLELEFVNLPKGETRTAEFILLNPGGRTPVLVDGDFTLWESNAIMQYLASKKGQHAVAPRCTRAGRHCALAVLAGRPLASGMRYVSLGKHGEENVVRHGR
jgi:glutathione S-transferase